ncbi:MAG TPA: thiamine-phosphate kinase [Longimicrobiales bacterium]|nr:thiamine-phosphate kinase [Longimicrobiales bacterium]
MTRPPRRRIALGPGAEFDLIRRFIDDEAPLPPEVRVGPGDDAAVLEGGWVVTTDLAIEDVHFRRSWLSDREIGYRAGAAALSDLAAMAATPVAVLVSIAAPRGGAVDLEAVQGGVREVAAELGASVVGGDVSRSPGPLVVDVVALGRTSWPVLRDGAEPGDDVWVTGSLGAAAAAVRAWEAGDEPGAALREAFARPRPRVREARCLVDHEVVDALIDVSDGVAGDAGHVAAASGVRITLEAAQIPVAEAALAAHGRDEALELALHGGDDYELCFVTDPGVVDVAYFRERYGLVLTRVGRVEAGEGVWLERPDGSVERLARGGFDHLAGSDA